MQEENTQTRKGKERNGTSLFSSPDGSYGYFNANNCTENVIIAGILHDTLEDTDTTPEEIKELFGEEILATVQTESEDKSKTWKERKQHTVDLLPDDSLETQLVCCADKLSNIKSIYADKCAIGEKIWERFNAPKENIKWYYESIAENLTKIKDYPMWSELNETIKKAFEGI